MTRRSAYLLLLIPALLWCAGFMLAPLLPPGSTVSVVLFRLYGRVCHQLPDRSLLWDLAPWAVCIRCSAIYVAFTATLAGIPLIRGLDRWRPLTPPLFAAWLVPVIADAALDLTGLHAAGTVTRLVTGALAGVGLALTVAPLFMAALARRHSPTLMPSPGESHARKTV